MAWHLYDENGRLVTREYTPNLNLTTKTVNAELLLNNTELSSSGAFDIDLSTITDGLNCVHLRIYALLRSSATTNNDVVYLFLNNDTTITNYYRQRYLGVSNNPVSDFVNTPQIAVVNGNMAETNNFSFVNITIFDYRNTTKEKIIEIEFGQYESTTVGRAGTTLLQWQNTASINRVQIRTDNHPTDLFVMGSEIWVYGEKSLDVLTNVTIS